MKQKIYLSILLFIFLIGIVTAEESGSLLIGKKGDCINLPQECASCSYINITSIQYPNISQNYINALMTKQGSSFNYTFCDTLNLGTYNYCVIGDIEGINTIVCKDYEITYLGKQLDSAKSILYIGFLTLLILIFFLNFYGMGFLPARNTRDEEGRIMSISYLKYLRNVLWMTGYFLFIGILYISSNLAFAFLEEELIAKTLFTIFKVSFGIAPVIIIVWMIFIFASMFHDREFQSMLNRGIFPQGKL